MTAQEIEKKEIFDLETKNVFQICDMPKMIFQENVNAFADFLSTSVDNSTKFSFFAVMT